MIGVRLSPISLIPLICVCAHGQEISTPKDRAYIQQAIRKLKSPDSAVRAKSARWIRSILEYDPKAAGDPGRKFWMDRFSSVMPGMSKAEVFKTLGGLKPSEEPFAGECRWGGNCVETFRLDDYWLATIRTTRQDNAFIVLVDLERKPIEILAEPKSRYNGLWTTYYIDGHPASEAKYVDGRPARYRSFHDNGRLSFESGEDILAGKRPQVGYFPDGRKHFRGSYAEGKKDGTWTYWRPDGTKEKEIIYRTGQTSAMTAFRENGVKLVELRYDGQGRETGHASWNENGQVEETGGTMR